ncbi:hypothetical protein H0H81_007576 [Sphagnurus paluster]|uniref:F-box domain-containing protein n=1 Tax=Sphagnurus paluster TaxID=117069 RepID=A0A9P7K4H4_9AGAR|nr:hypothetical protein H0H81_007576 [Sphagnurus paluster]
MLTQPGSPEKRLATAVDLPPELLLKIFQEFFDASRSQKKYPLQLRLIDFLREVGDADAAELKELECLARIEREDRLRETDWSSEDIRSPTLFPAALARVCRTWQKALSICDVFWTRVVIYIDDPDYLEYTRYLEYSGELHITVAVMVRNEDAFLNSPEEEQHRTRKLIDAIAPHIPRCMTLSFEVTYTSSLPRIGTDFTLVAPQLQSLMLNASIPNGLPGFMDGTELVDYIFPALKHLEIDGYNFIELRTKGRRWLSQFSETTKSGKYHSLAVTHYRPIKDQNGQASDDFHIDLVAPLFELFGELTLDDVRFQSFGGLIPGEFRGSPESLKLRNLSSEFTAAMVHSYSAAFLTLYRCPLSEIVSISLCTLRLVEIDYPNFSDDLARLLFEWEGGSTLTIETCPGLDDTVLEVLGKTRKFLQATTLVSPMLSELDIVNCRGFNFSTLKRVVESRRLYITLKDIEQYFESDCFDISVVNGPVMDEEDRRWLKDYGQLGTIAHTPPT